MYRVFLFLTVSLLLFMLWVTHQVTLGKTNVIMDLARVLPAGDKIGHFSLFGLLCAVAICATKFKRISLFNCTVYWAVVLVGLYAVVDEAIQYYSPNRTLDVFDLLAGLSGVLCAQLIGLSVEKYLLKPQPPR